MSYTIDQIVAYKNGSPAIYRGQIKKIKEGGYYLVIDLEPASQELWNAGYAIGTDIHKSQILENMSGELPYSCDY